MTGRTPEMVDIALWRNANTQTRANSEEGVAQGNNPRRLKDVPLKRKSDDRIICGNETRNLCVTGHDL